MATTQQRARHVLSFITSNFLPHLFHCTVLDPKRSVMMLCVAFATALFVPRWCVWVNSTSKLVCRLHFVRVTCVNGYCLCKASQDLHGNVLCTIIGALVTYKH